MEENIYRLAGDDDGKILFFGDNYATDCMAAETNSNWDSVCIMEDLRPVNYGPSHNHNIWGSFLNEKLEDGSTIPCFWHDYVPFHVKSVVHSCECDYI